MNIYLTQNGQQLGPYTIAQLQDLVRGGTVTMADFAWYEGLPNWVPLAQIPGMVVAGEPIVEAPQKRPVLVWIICLLCFTCLPFSLISMVITPTIIASSKASLPEAQQHYFASLGFFNHYLPQTINFILILVWSIQLFRLKKNSIYFFLGSLGLGLIMLLVNIFGTNWLASVEGYAIIGAIAGMIIAWFLNALLLYYNWYLIKKGVLR